MMQPITNSPNHFLFFYAFFVGSFLSVMLNPHVTSAQQPSLELSSNKELLTIPEPPPITREMLQALGVSVTAERKDNRTAKVSNINKYFAINWSLSEGGTTFNRGLLNSAGFSGMQNLSGLGPCVFDATKCGQYSQYAQSTVASALGYWNLDYGTETVNYSLDLLNGLLPGGQSWNQFLGQYPAPGGQTLNSYGSSSQSYADATYNLTYSPQIQAILGYDPNSSYNFTTQFLNYTSSLFSPTADWNSSFSLFPSATGSYIGSRTAQDESLAGRYAAIAHQQLENQHTDQALSAIRTEGYTMQVWLLLQDPYYMYYNYLMNSSWAQIYTNSQTYTNSQNYNNLLYLTAEIGSWTNPPEDEPTLIERYYKRYLLNYYQTLFQYDVLFYLYNHPQDYQTVTYYATLTNEQINRIYALPVVVDWYNEWLQRYQTAHFASSTLEEMMNDLLTDYPAFQEYMDLLQQIREVIKKEEVSNRTSVQNATDQVITLQSQQNFNNVLSQQYQGYQNRVNELLGQTSYIAQIERYYEQLNGLMVEDLTYQALLQQYQQIQQEMQAYQAEMVTGVYNCIQQYGNACNAYYDPTVVALVQSERPANIASKLAAFYENYYLFWYEFYNSQMYHSLEEDAQQALEKAIAHVTPQIEAARKEYKLGVDAMPEISEIKTEMLTVANDLHSIILPESGMTVGAALDEMSRLVASLDETANKAPTDISLSNNELDENQPDSTLVGVLSVDVDAEGSYTYALVAGEGDDDNALFEIIGDQLITKEPLDFEQKESYQIRIQVTDAHGNTFEKTITINVNDLEENQPPVVLNTIVDTVATIGELFSFTLPQDIFSDPDVDDTLTFQATLEDGSPLPSWLNFDAATITFSGTPPDDASGSITITVNASDQKGATVSNDFVLIIEKVTGIGDGDQSTAIKIYPNPSSARIFIVDMGPVVQSEITYELYTLQGQLIARGKKVVRHSNQIFLDLSSYNPGNYMILFHVKGQILSKKIILQ